MMTTISFLDECHVSEICFDERTHGSLQQTEFYKFLKPTAPLLRIMKLQAQLAFDHKGKDITDPLSFQNCRINHIDSTDSHFACSGNEIIKLYDIGTGQIIKLWTHPECQSFSDLQFAINDPHLLLGTTARPGEHALIGVNDIRVKSEVNGEVAMLSHPQMNSKGLKAKDKRGIEFYSGAMGGNIIAGSDKDRVYLWDLRMIRKGNMIPTQLKGFHSEPIYKLRFNPLHHRSDCHLISASEDGLMNEFDITRGGGTVIDLDTDYNSESEEEDGDNGDDQGDFEEGPLLSTYPLRGSIAEGAHNFGIFRDEIGTFGVKGQHLTWVITINRSLDIHKLEDWSSSTGNVGNEENTDDDDCKMKGTEDDDPEICWFDQLRSGNMSCFECVYDDQQTKELYLLSGNPSFSHCLSPAVYVLC